MSSNAGKRLTYVDPGWSLLLVAAADEAYDAGGKVPNLPGGWQFATSFKSHYKAWWWDESEPAGVVFLRKTTARPDMIVAFRGTYSIIDLLADFDWSPTPFIPFQGSPPPGVHVGKGFLDLYRTKGHLGAASEQEQLFSLINTIKPGTLRITGHSLGAATAALFALDLGLSWSHLNPQNLPNYVGTTQFSSPCAGDKGFATLYGKLPWELKPGNSTVHIYNYQDVVPCYPWDSDFYALGNYFLVDFWSTQFLDADLYALHSVDNLQAVLKVALATAGQQYKGPVNGDIPLTSNYPPAVGQDEWCTESFKKKTVITKLKRRDQKGYGELR